MTPEYSLIGRISPWGFPMAIRKNMAAIPDTECDFMTIWIRVY
jgi:hypothetical protein